ncbi:uncharacterized protein [Acropora muricata]|uniref:uncharacterized protein n=1 Tax=Acropora muricata TaxID=159855 RepID=UPI0034E39616
MAVDAQTLDALMILVCALALVILIALVAYTWIIWHREQLQNLSSNERGPSEIEVVGVSRAAPYQGGYMNEATKNSPNLSGSRTFLGEEVLREKPFSNVSQPSPPFKSNGVIYKTGVERNAGDVAFHTIESYNRGRNETVDGIKGGHVAQNIDERDGRRRWSESTVRTGDSHNSEASHRKNTYL